MGLITNTNMESGIIRRLSIVLLVLTLCSTLIFGIQSDEHNIREFGAAGDGVKIETKAIQAAVDKCAAAGGIVIIPKGRYITGTIYESSLKTFKI